MADDAVDGGVIGRLLYAGRGPVPEKPVERTGESEQSHQES